MDVKRLVDAYVLGLGDNSDNADLLQTLSQRIVSGDTSLLELVQALGSYLASDEASRRSRGIHVLSDVLNDIPQDAIPAQAATKLTEFFCARLSDATCVPHILTSIGALFCLPSFTDQLTVAFLNELFKEVHVQSFQHSTRSTAYQLLDTAIQKHPNAIWTMGDNFVLGFAQMLDGEKDPRSLIVAFQTIPKIVDLVDVKNNAEDLFDVIFCYFPITFKHRDGDPSAITPEALKLALRTALTCTPYFGSLAVKQLVNKTSATSASAKIDAFETLVAGAQVYSPDVFTPELEILVEQIREDVIMASNDSVVDAALNALEAIYGAISPTAPSEGGGSTDQMPGVTENSSPLDHVLKEAIFQLTADEIKNPDQTGKILRAVARSSAYNCSVVSDAVIPIVTERLETTEALTVRRELMDVLNYVLSANCDASRKAECLATEKENLLDIYRPETSIPVDNEHGFLHMVRLKGITLLTILPGFLNSNETTIALQTLARAAIERNVDENVNKEGAHLLVQLAQSSPEDIKSTVLPMFFEALREEAPSVHKVSRLLNALGAIGVAAPNVLLALLQGIVSLVVSGGLAHTHASSAVTTIRKIVEAVIASSNNPSLCQDILLLAVAPLADWVVDASGSGKQPPEQLISEAAKTTVAVFSKLGPDLQAEKLKPLFEKLYPTISSATESKLFPALPLFSAAVCSCRPETVFPIDSTAAFAERLVSVALETTSEVHRTACFEIVATLINKTKSPAARAELTNSVLKHSGDSNSAETSESLVLLHHWAARALVNCNDSAGYRCIRWLVAQITREESLYARLAADGFSIILGNHGWAVSSATHGVCKLLAKQRFYTTVLPEITQSFSGSTSDTVKTNLLIVLTNVVQYMPRNVLMGGIEPIMPLLISAARLTDGALKAASIRTITMVILESPETIKLDLASTIVPLLLLATTASDQSNTIEVRRAALDALTLIPEKYSYTSITMVAKDVVRALARARDDRKRLVRNDAVKAYNKWLSFGS